MSGDLFSCYSNCKENIETLRALFEWYDVDVAIVLRYQVDWLRSCYKESIQEHHYQRINDFFNTKERYTINYPPKNNDKGYAECNPFLLNYVSIVQEYYNWLGKENVHILFYEDFVKDKDRFLAKFFDILGVDRSLIVSDKKIVNKGYKLESAFFAIPTSNLLKKIGLGCLVPSPIFFFGEKSVYIILRTKRKFFGRGIFWRFLFKKISAFFMKKEKINFVINFENDLHKIFCEQNQKLSILLSAELPKIYLCKSRDK